MLLLVSVRDAVETAAAVAAGADILDAKEPGGGALAPVAPGVLLEIANAVPATVPLSVALGEGSSAELLEAVETVPILPRRTTWFKFALVGARHPADASRLRAAADRMAMRPDAPGLVLARYADDGLDALRAHVQLAGISGARGVLLDTRDKSGGPLLSRISEDELTGLSTMAAGAGLWLALAGRLGAADFPAMVRIGARVVGVRGAACVAGRSGRLSGERILALRAALAEATVSRAPPAVPV